MFKKFEKPSLTNDQVLTELQKLESHGWEIRSGDNPQHYIIVFDDSKIVNIIAVQDGGWQIQSYRDGVNRMIKTAYSSDSLKRILNEFAKDLEYDIELPANNPIRLRRIEPASNKTKILTLISGRHVVDIYDPYFDTKSIETLLSLSKLGLKFKTHVRCLTSKTAGQIDKMFLSDFNKELAINLELRICSSKNEHRRFLILEDGHTIIIGCSVRPGSCQNKTTNKK